MTTNDYLSDDETIHRRELAFGVVREPPAPFYSHQALVLRMARLLCDHVEPRGLGHVAIAPVDVVLDAERNLVVQPDVLFIAASRFGIVRRQVWGAPDLVVEVVSSGTVEWDTTEKREWYGHYGVREYWIVDPSQQEVTIIEYAATHAQDRMFAGADPIRSTVLPELQISAFGIFA